MNHDTPEERALRHHHFEQRRKERTGAMLLIAVLLAGALWKILAAPGLEHKHLALIIACGAAVALYLTLHVAIGWIHEMPQGSAGPDPSEPAPDK